MAKNRNRVNGRGGANELIFVLPRSGIWNDRQCYAGEMSSDQPMAFLCGLDSVDVMIDSFTCPKFPALSALLHKPSTSPVPTYRDTDIVDDWCDQDGYLWR